MTHGLPDGSQAYRVIRLNSRTEPHRMNLKDDYELIRQATEGRKRQDAIDTWIKGHLSATYVRILPDYAGCPFQHPWIHSVGQ